MKGDYRSFRNCSSVRTGLFENVLEKTSIEVAGVHRDGGVPASDRMLESQMTSTLVFFDESSLQKSFADLLGCQVWQSAHASCGIGTDTPKIVGCRESAGIGSPLFASASR